MIRHMLVDTSEREAESGQYVRECTCGFSSSGPKAPEEFIRHILIEG